MRNERFAYASELDFLRYQNWNGKQKKKTNHYDEIWEDLFALAAWHLTLQVKFITVALGNKNKNIQKKSESRFYWDTSCGII